MTAALRPDRVLFLVSAHNGLSQRAYIELAERGHEVAIAVVDTAAEMEAAVLRHCPELIVCPMLKRFIPESIWTRYRCLIVHPGPSRRTPTSSSLLSAATRRPVAFPSRLPPTGWWRARTSC